MKTVLVAEDEPSLRRVYEKELTAEGYDVVTASDAKEAIDKATTTTCDLIVMDIRMPGMDGIEASESHSRAEQRTSDHHQLGLQLVHRELHELAGRSVRDQVIGSLRAQGQGARSPRAAGSEAAGGGRLMRDPKILTMILAGGIGERLYPLTANRSKPAVPFGGNFRIIDFTLMNCVLSGLKNVHVLTQYHSLSLGKHKTDRWELSEPGARRVHRASPALACGRRRASITAPPTRSIATSTSSIDTAPMSFSSSPATTSTGPTTPGLSTRILPTTPTSRSSRTGSDRTVRAPSVSSRVRTA